MATPVTMPQLGETVVEGTIVKWLKGEGDEIERDEPLFEISTDKVDTEVPSPIGGVLKEIKVQEGETVGVGTELALIEEAGAAGDGQASGDGQAAAEEAAPEEPEEEPAKAEEEPAQAAEEPRGEEPDEEQRPGAGEEERQPAARADGGDRSRARGKAEAPAGGGPRSQILSPLVRRLAEENDVDLAEVQGTGAGGRITKKDVLAFVDGRGERPPLRAVPEPAAAPAAAAQAIPEPAAGRAGGAEREETVRISHIRKRIAENMQVVLQNIARAWNLVEVDFENIVRVRARAKDPFKEREGISLTYTPFVSRAVCDALLAFPDVNASLDLEAGTATYRRYVNLGMAVSYEGGLIVPVIRGADEMNLMGLARAINDIAARARSKKLKPDEVHGGTFTITNPGPFGSLISVPIPNPGETAILAFDAVEKRPVVRDDAIAIRHMAYLSMSWDHRMIDGAVASQFLGRIKQNLETWDFSSELQAYLS